MPTYNDTPLATQTPAASQSLMRDNFTQISNSYGTDHVPFTGSTQGYHKQVTFNAPLAADPGKLSPVASLYTKTITGNEQLFFQNASQVIQITGLSSADQVSGTLSGGGAGGNFTVFSLPIGIRIWTGKVTGLSNGVNTTITLSTGTFGATVYTGVASGGTLSKTVAGYALAGAGVNTMNCISKDVAGSSGSDLYFLIITS